MGVTIMDYLTLAKAGYKKADIDKILSQPEKADETNPEEQRKDAGAINEPKPVDPEPTEATEKDEKPEPKEDEIDYKSLYEKSQEDLKAAQAANRAHDNSGANNADLQADLRAIVGSYF